MFLVFVAAAFWPNQHLTNERKVVPHCRKSGGALVALRGLEVRWRRKGGLNVLPFGVACESGGRLGTTRLMPAEGADGAALADAEVR